jgi:hypothetical protein
MTPTEPNEHKPYTREEWAAAHPEASWEAIIKLKRQIAAAELLMADVRETLEKLDESA